MNLNLSKVLMTYIFTFTMVGFFILLFYGTNPNITAPDYGMLGNYTQMYTATQTAIGGNWGQYFSWIETPIIYALLPISYIVEAFVLIGNTISYVISYTGYIISFFPTILVAVLSVILATIFIVSVITSIRIANSEIK